MLSLLSITARIIASLDFISAFQSMIHFIYHFIVDSFITGTLKPTNDQIPMSVASMLSWLERRTGKREVTGSNTVEVLKVSRNSYICVHKCEDP